MPGGFGGVVSGGLGTGVPAGGLGAGVAPGGGVGTGGVPAGGYGPGGVPGGYGPGGVPRSYGPGTGGKAQIVIHIQCNIHILLDWQFHILLASCVLIVGYPSGSKALKYGR